MFVGSFHFWRALEIAVKKRDCKNTSAYLQCKLIFAAVLPALKMEKDTSKLKRNIALLCERLNKGASLSTNQSQRRESIQSSTLADKTLGG